jgi:hypothetical protein
MEDRGANLEIAGKAALCVGCSESLISDILCRETTGELRADKIFGDSASLRASKNGYCHA